MRKLIGRVLVVLAFGWAASASAAHMSTIYVDAREWLQPLDFVTSNWNEISSKCDATTGACTGILGATDVTGYTWASVDDVNSLFNFIVGNSALGPGPDFAFYAYQTVFPLFTNIGFLPTGVGSTSVALAGFTRTIENYPYVDPDEAFIGRVYSACNFSCIETDVPDRDNTSTSDTIPLDVFGFGGWFFRATPQPPTQVPTPATLPLLGLGLAALGFSRRKRTPIS